MSTSLSYILIISKCYIFQVTESDSQKNCLLSWQSYGPDKYLESKDMQAALNSLQNISVSKH